MYILLIPHVCFYLSAQEVDPSWTVDPALFELAEEKALHEAVTAVRGSLNPAKASPKEFLASCVPLAKPIDAYFEKVGAGHGAAVGAGAWCAPGAAHARGGNKEHGDSTRQAARG